MTYLLKYLPSLELLIDELESYPHNIYNYVKYDTFIGDSDSVEYLNTKLYNLNKKNDKKT
jgi:hypothetical protein